MGDWFKTTVGTRQGDPISPTTFIPYLERVMDSVRDNGTHTRWRWGSNITNYIHPIPRESNGLSKRQWYTHEMALLCSAAIRAAPLRLCFYLLFYLLLISIFTHITSALITYDKSALLDIGNRFTNLVQDTLSPNPSWPLEILRNAENKGHRRRNKKHRGKSAGIRNRLRKSAHSPPLPSLLLANVQSLDNKMDDLRARISFQRT